MSHNFKPGDKAKVKASGGVSMAAQALAGKVVTIKKVKPSLFSNTHDTHFVDIEEHGGGIWLNEIESIADTMRKFKKGDRVRALESYHGFIQEGSIYEVNKYAFDQGYVYVYDEDERSFAAPANTFTLISPVPAPTPRKPRRPLAPGDRVAVYCRFGRRVGTVIEMDDPQYYSLDKAPPLPEEILVELDHPVVDHPDAVARVVHGIMCFPQQCRRLKPKAK